MNILYVYAVCLCTKQLDHKGLIYSRAIKRFTVSAGTRANLREKKFHSVFTFTRWNHLLPSRMYCSLRSSQYIYVRTRHVPAAIITQRGNDEWTKRDSTLYGTLTFTRGSDGNYQACDVRCSLVHRQPKWASRKHAIGQSIGHKTVERLNQEARKILFTR